MATGAETDTSEIVNEMIESVHSFGRCGITGVNVEYVCFFCLFSFHSPASTEKWENGLGQITLIWDPSCSAASDSSEMAKPLFTCTGKTS